MITDTPTLKSLLFLPHAHLEFWSCIGNTRIFSVAMIILSVTCITCDYWPVSSHPRSMRGGHLCLLPMGCQWYFPLTLQLTAQASQVCVAWHRNLNCLTATGVDDLFFLFFICLDSCGRNSAGV